MVLDLATLEKQISPGSVPCRRGKGAGEGGERYGMESQAFLLHEKGFLMVLIDHSANISWKIYQVPQIQWRAWTKFGKFETVHSGMNGMVTKATILSNWWFLSSNNLLVIIYYVYLVTRKLQVNWL